MKTALKLLIALALLNAAARGGAAVWNYYQLKDAAERALLFGAKSTSQQLHTQIIETAMELEIPLKPEALSVRWRTGRRVAHALYTQPVEFFPGYSYPILFSFNVDAVSPGASPDNDDYPPGH
jgi:hypothetical protein